MMPSLTHRALGRAAIFAAALCTLSAHAIFTPLEIRPGRITGCTVEADAVEMNKLKELLLAKKFDPGEYHPTALAKVSPAAGKSFVIFEIRLEPDRSVGRHDYAIQVQDVRETYPCKAMAIGGKPFDPRLWEVTAQEAGIDPVLLLYETAEIDKPTRIVLIPNLNLDIPQENVELTVQPQDWVETKPAVEPLADPTATAAPEPENPATE